MGNGSLTCDEAPDRLTPGIVCIHHVRYPDNNVSVSPPVMQSHAVSCSVTTPLKWSPARLLCWPVPPVITDTFPASFDGLDQLRRGAGRRDGDDGDRQP